MRKNACGCTTINTPLCDFPQSNGNDNVAVTVAVNFLHLFSEVLLYDSVESVSFDFGRLIRIFHVLIQL